MRGVARGLIVGLALTGLAPHPAVAQQPDFTRALRDLDGGQFLEDEPIWVCDPAAPLPRKDWKGFRTPGWIVGLEATGDSLASELIPLAFMDGRHPRAGDLTRAQWIERRLDLHPLDVGVWGGGGLRAGSYEIIVQQHGVARFHVIAPRASESAVRAALARAARLSRVGDVASRIEAARLYEAVIDRYPRTSYVASIYAGLWRLRAHTKAYATDPGLWLDVVFAHFHDTCFGVWALDRFMADVPAENARPRLRKLVGLYPDTRLSRAALRYL